MFFTEIDRFQDQGSGFKVQRLQPIDIAHNIDMAAKRRKKHKNKISGRVNSMCYYEQKSKL